MRVAGRIVCLGDPVVDILARTDPESLERNGITPGGCIPTNKVDLEALLANVKLSEGIERYISIPYPPYRRLAALILVIRLYSTVLETLPSCSKTGVS
jgi:hypothetical protein